MQIPIVNGIYTDEKSDFRTSYPRNLVPVPKANGISKGYLRPHDGIVPFGAGPGVDRGGINWNDVCYRVMGTKLIKILSDGSYVNIGDVGSGGQVTFDYGATYLAVASGGRFYLYDGSTLTQNTDSDLGVVIDFIWIDGYYMTTDGTFIIVTELNDPFSVNPLKYGSSEADPDPIKAVLKIRNEAYALNRHTIEVFDNIGGSTFPFQRIEGAQIEKGTIGTHSCCVYDEKIAFMGSALNEAVSIYIAINGQIGRIATREIDEILLTYTQEELSTVVFETRIDKGHQHLWVRLPDQTLVYDAAASAIIGEPVWFILTTGLTEKGRYKAQNLVRCYDKWLVADPVSSSHGYLDDSLSSHWGETNAWEFGTTIIYNEGKGIIFKELELVCLTGRVSTLINPVISTQYSLDGVTWSQERTASAGQQGQRNKRIAWIPAGYMRNWRIQRFKGDSDSHLSISALEADVEPLNV